jgi:NAD(P) transhydrogenase subunit alpha
VIVDLAVERGGNVEGAKAGEVVTTANGVKIVGHLNVPGRVAASASLLYAKNLYAFLETLIDKGSSNLAINREDELVKATMLTDAGEVVHPSFTRSDAGPAKHVEPIRPANRKTLRKAGTGSASVEAPNKNVEKHEKASRARPAKHGEVVDPVKPSAVRKKGAAAVSQDSPQQAEASEQAKADGRKTSTPTDGDA